ncbi:hypothetical protein O181_104508 [Austropuccinia psidii MF-1]|uniref:Reverse transcriptase domain-containing protein n=1 Tax=Austropuccinia psidii MF-1 TaxID=1389203 RepID=A0A9Q3JMD4_9BASI|nr:hypothetical protein [Austropuccinia psidii MF-1]
MLRRPPYPESLETRTYIEKHANKLPDMDFIRNSGHNEIVEVNAPVLITWNDCKSRLWGDLQELSNYTKDDSYPVPRIPHSLDKLARSKYITNMYCMRVFNQNGVKPNSRKLLRIICQLVILKYNRILFGIQNSPAHFQRMMDTIFQEWIMEGWMLLYIDYIIIY